MKCPKCGAENPEGSRKGSLCNNCGEPLVAAQDIQNEYIEKFYKNVEVQLPNPKDIETLEEMLISERFSILKKADGTFCIRNENTGDEGARFQHKEDAKVALLSLIKEDLNLK